MIAWQIHHKAETVSTNLDARAGAHGDVFTADYQTAGRGRLDHKWLSPPNTNLALSAALSVEGLDPAHVATLPLVAGLAVVRAIVRLLPALSPRLKWPNDVWIDGEKKVCGILCERVEDRVIVGIGINVGKQIFPPELRGKAACLAAYADATKRVPPTVVSVRDALLDELAALYERWCQDGFAALQPEIAAYDALRGECVTVRQVDNDATPLEGISGGINADGSLDVGGRAVYAGEVNRCRIASNG